MELSWDGMLYQRMMTCKVVKMMSGYIEHEDLKLWPHGSRSSQIAHQRARFRQTWKNKSSQMSMTSVMSWKNQVARMTMGQLTEGSRFQSHLKKTWPLLFLFHHWWRCTFDWEVMGVWEDTGCLLVEKKKLEDEYKDSDMLPTVNKLTWWGQWRPLKKINVPMHETWIICQDGINKQIRVNNKD